jgi:hypothetical protein
MTVRRSTHERDVWLGVGAGGAVVAAVLALVSLRSCHDPKPTPRDLAVTWTVTPSWDRRAAPARPAATGKGGGESELYMDMSIPIGGFLPPPGRKEESAGFPYVVDLVHDHLVQDRLLTAGGGAHAVVSWIPFGAAVGQAAAPPHLDRRLFNERETRLDLALSRITSGFNEGRIRAAALITDLNASNDETGALGAAGPLRDWMASPGVISGDLHMALLATRSSFWGVHAGRCPTPAGDLGCWYSERARGYRQLHAVAQAPFYVLLAGRGRQAVEQMAAGIVQQERERRLKPEWELLTAASTPQVVEASCRLSASGAAAEPQYALTRGADGRWQCVQDDRVELRCDLPAAGQLADPRIRVSWQPHGQSAQPDEQSAVSARIAEPGPPARPGAAAPRQVVVTLDCARLRNSPPAGDLTLTLEGTPPPPEANRRWDDWTTGSDDREADVPRTVQLNAFVNSVRLRPQRLVLSSSPLMKMSAADGHR